jgi:hypothetical protein
MAGPFRILTTPAFERKFRAISRKGHGNRVVDRLQHSSTICPTIPPDHLHKHSLRPTFFQHLPQAFSAGHDDRFGKQREAADEASFSAVKNSADQFLFVNRSGNIDTGPGTAIQNRQSRPHEALIQLPVDVTVKNLDGAIQVSLAAKFAVVFPRERCDTRRTAVHSSAKERLIVDFLAGMLFEERAVEG